MRALAPFLLTAVVTTAAAADDWVLMGREGGCTEIAGAQQRRFADLPRITSPQQMAEELRQRGAEVRLNALAPGSNDAWLVEVPARELSLLFVSRERCASVDAPRRAR